MNEVNGGEVLITCHHNATVTAANAANPAISPSPNGSSVLYGVIF